MKIVLNPFNPVENVIIRQKAQRRDIIHNNNNNDTNKQKPVEKEMFKCVR